MSYATHELQHALWTRVFCASGCSATIEITRDRHYASVIAVILPEGTTPPANISRSIQRNLKWDIPHNGVPAGLHDTATDRPGSHHGIARIANIAKGQCVWLRSMDPMHKVCVSVQVQHHYDYAPGSAVLTAPITGGASTLVTAATQAGCGCAAGSANTDLNQTVYNAVVNADHTIADTDFTNNTYGIAVSSTAPATTITLPAGMADGSEVRVSRLSSANAVTVVSAGADKVAGDASGAVINEPGMVLFRYNGVLDDWQIVQVSPGEAAGSPQVATGGPVILNQPDAPPLSQSYLWRDSETGQTNISNGASWVPIN